MEAKSSAKVGVVVLLALALGIRLYLFVSHLSTGTYDVGVDISDTQGLTQHSVVRMLGVPIGEVKQVDLDSNNRPVVVLAIKDKYSIPSDDTLSVVSGIITAGVVQIGPPQKPHAEPVAYLTKDGKARITAQPPGSLLRSLDPKLETTIDNLNKSFTELHLEVATISKKMGGILDQTSTLMATANKVAGTANGFISDPHLKRTLFNTLDNMQATTEDAHRMTTQLRRDLDDLVGSSKGNLKDMGAKVNSILDHVDDAIQNTNTVVQKLTDQVTDPHLQQSLQETAELAQATLARFNQIASDIHELTGDPQLQGALKQDVVEVGGLTQTARKTLENVNSLVDKFSGISKTPGLHLPHIALTANLSEQFSPSLFRADLDAIMPFGRSNLIDLGLYDVGRNTRLTLEVGNYLTKQFDVRYGLYAGKLSAGMDYQATRSVGFRADLWDPDYPRLDVRTLFRVNKNASLWFGAQDVFHTPAAILGIQFNP